MLPQDPNTFTPKKRTDWMVVDVQWFQQLASAPALSVAEKVHLARIATQQQWVADIEDSTSKRKLLKALGLFIAAVDPGYLIVSGNPVFAEYVEFRKRELSTIEAGILYGYPPSAVLAFTGILPLISPQPWPTSCATYFLGGAYSSDHTARELEFFARQWDELERQAPDICRLAEASFKASQR